jgi:3'(2'), 5'-bisphosphate nucleotidase
VTAEGVAPSDTDEGPVDTDEGPVDTDEGPDGSARPADAAQRGPEPTGSPETDARLAARLAEEAGELLLRIRDAAGDSLHPYELGRLGDEKANAFILEGLAADRPNDAVLSEEASDDLRRLWRNRVWIVDPLDGTREYSMSGRWDWAVHIALWEEGAGLTAAAVAMPALGEVFATDRPVARPHNPREAPVVLVSGSRPPGFSWAVAEAVGGELATIGSAGAKAMAVLTGHADAYVHAGGQWEWDSAAPVGVVTASGLFTSRIDGSPLLYNQPDPYLPDLVICRQDLAEPILRAIADHLG